MAERGRPPTGRLNEFPQSAHDNRFSIASTAKGEPTQNLRSKSFHGRCVCDICTCGKHQCPPSASPNRYPSDMRSTSQDNFRAYKPNEIRKANTLGVAKSPAHKATDGVFPTAPTKDQFRTTNQAGLPDHWANKTLDPKQLRYSPKVSANQRTFDIFPNEPTQDQFQRLDTKPQNRPYSPHSRERSPSGNNSRSRGDQQIPRRANDVSPDFPLNHSGQYGPGPGRGTESSDSLHRTPHRGDKNTGGAQRGQDRAPEYYGDEEYNPDKNKKSSQQTQPRTPPGADRRKRPDLAESQTDIDGTKRRDDPRRGSGRIGPQSNPNFDSINSAGLDDQDSLVPKAKKDRYGPAKGLPRPQTNQKQLIPHNREPQSPPKKTAGLATNRQRDSNIISHDQPVNRQRDPNAIYHDQSPNRLKDADTIYRDQPTNRGRDTNPIYNDSPANRLRDSNVIYQDKPADRQKDANAVYRDSPAGRLRDSNVIYQDKPAGRQRDSNIISHDQPVNRQRDPNAIYHDQSPNRLKDADTIYRDQPANRGRDTNAIYNDSPANRLRDSNVIYQDKPADRQKDANAVYRDSPAGRLRDSNVIYQDKPADRQRDSDTIDRDQSAKRRRDPNAIYHDQSPNRLKDADTIYRDQPANRQRDINAIYKDSPAGRLRDSNAMYHDKPADRQRDADNIYHEQSPNRLRDSDVIYQDKPADRQKDANAVYRDSPAGRLRDSNVISHEQPGHRRRNSKAYLDQPAARLRDSNVLYHEQPGNRLRESNVISHEQPADSAVKGRRIPKEPAIEYQEQEEDRGPSRQTPRRQGDDRANNNNKPLSQSEVFNPFDDQVQRDLRTPVREPRNRDERFEQIPDESARKSPMRTSTPTRMRREDNLQVDRTLPLTGNSVYNQDFDGNQLRPQGGTGQTAGKPALPSDVRDGEDRVFGKIKSLKYNDIKTVYQDDFKDVIATNFMKKDCPIYGLPKPPKVITTGRLHVYYDEEENDWN